MVLNREVDHVTRWPQAIAWIISQYKFLAPELVREVRQLDGYPDVTAGFATSVPGLHFVGATAARKFGPLLYFVTGTDFASRELTSWLRRHRD